MAARKTTKSMTLALMRGINVGKANRLAMADLAAAFAELGCTDVVTRGNTGNVLFRAPATVLRRLPKRVQALLLERHGVKSPVILRSQAELAAICRQNPFVAEGCDPGTLHVTFLAAEPERARVAALAPERSLPDRFAVIDREVYLHCPNGLARTKLSNLWFDRELATISTVRTWNVVSQLHERMG
ncbi:MAG TPA: DUF1697 domain-containing protein [Enhygromyxa sp.]|nr:DUF1697 domain-containing protein [Enhygromyxa sp.]